jgi:uncharacterized YigZ family protein
MTEPGYAVPAAKHRTEELIQRSRFITTLGRAASAEEARAFIASVREEYGDATHNCWAYVAGPPGTTTAIGMSDAGEPHGTAGRPMLDVLLHSDVGEIVAVVTRYYGGVKLGKGGLVRAYGGTVQNALRSLPTSRRVECTRLAVTVGYADVETLRRVLAEHDADVLEAQYGGEVTYHAAVPVASVTALEQTLGNATAGRARVVRE